MGIKVRCANCQAGFLVNEQKAGQTFSCLKCGHAIAVPRVGSSTDSANPAGDQPSTPPRPLPRARRTSVPPPVPEAPRPALVPPTPVAQPEVAQPMVAEPTPTFPFVVDTSASRPGKQTPAKTAAAAMPTASPGRETAPADSNGKLVLLTACACLLIFTLAGSGALVWMVTSVPAKPTPAEPASVEVATNTASRAVAVTTPAESTAPRAPATTQESLADVIERIGDAVVLITVFDEDGDECSLGTGFVIDRDGSIATNYHVISRGHSARVEFHDGFQTDVVGAAAYSAEADLAILSIAQRPEKLAVMTLAPDENLRQGADCIAIGHPRGFGFSVSTGIISAVRTTERLPGELPQILRAPADQQWIQTTAAISGGNSGGPLLTPDGRVLGINTWVAPDGQNLGFASHIQHLIDLRQKASTPAVGLAVINQQEMERVRREIAPAVAERLDEVFAAADATGWAPQSDEQAEAIQNLAEGLWFTAKRELPVTRLAQLRAQWTNHTWNYQPQIQKLNQFAATTLDTPGTGVFCLGTIIATNEADTTTHVVKLLGRGLPILVIDLSPRPRKFDRGDSCLVVGLRVEDGADREKTSLFERPPVVEAAMLVPARHDTLPEWTQLVELRDLVDFRATPEVIARGILSAYDTLPQATLDMSNSRPQFAHTVVEQSGVGLFVFQMPAGGQRDLALALVHTSTRHASVKLYELDEKPGRMLTVAGSLKTAPTSGDANFSYDQTLHFRSVYGSQLTPGNRYALLLVFPERDEQPFGLHVAMRPTTYTSSDPSGVMARVILKYNTSTSSRPTTASPAPRPPAASANGPGTAAAAPTSISPAEAQANRAAAEWVLKQQGTVSTQEVGKPEATDISLAARLPRAEFCVTSIHIRTKNTLSAAELKNCSGLRKLHTLRLEGGQIGDAGLRYLDDLPELRTLILMETNLTDSALPLLKRYPALLDLQIVGSQISDRRLSDLTFIPSLRLLALSSCRISDTGLRTLARLPLVQLDLSKTRVTDSGVAHLAEMQYLKVLSLNGNEVSGKCLEQVARISSLIYLGIGETGIAADELAPLLDMPKLTMVQVYNTRVSTAEAQDLTAKHSRIKFVPTPGRFVLNY